jgi:hypothetical protein
MRNYRVMGRYSEKSRAKNPTGDISLRAGYIFEARSNETKYPDDNK